MILVTVTEHITVTFWSKTAGTVPMAEKAHTAYGDARTIDDNDRKKFGLAVGSDNKKIYMYIVSLTRRRSFRGRKFSLYLSRKSSDRNVYLQLISIW